MSDQLLDKLNNAQRDAVVSVDGPVMVMAGAGSGKTRVLTHRIAYIIDENIAYPSEILAVTFTNKAAREMKERVARLVDLNTNNMWISTFHSFCARLLRIEADNIKPYTKQFVIIDDDDSLKILKEIFKNKEIQDVKPKIIQSFISKSKNLEKFEIRDYKARLIFKDVLREYNEMLKKDNLMDFDDLLLNTLSLFQNNDEILRKYQNKFKYIMVDEFQDTNILQYMIIKLIGLNHHNIFVVGDQDQSIYSFRGARIENIDLFRRDFLETKIILLEQNYRSTKEILDAANSVIDKNDGRIKKNLFTDNTSSEKPFYYQADTAYDEVMFVVDKIKELIISGYEYRDFAIMYRINSLSRSVEDALIRYQIPYRIYGGISFFGRKEIKDIIAYLRLIVNLDDDFSFKRIVNEPKRKIGASIMDKLKAVSIERGVSLYQAIDFISSSGIGYHNLLDFKFTILELREEVNNLEITKIIDEIIRKTGYLDMLNEEGDEGKDRLDNIYELKTLLKESKEFYDVDTNFKVLESMLLDIALRTDSDNVSDNDDCVKLMSYHQAKGLEFRVVFMIATEEGIFPSMNSINENNVDEERRICYVGITRAKEKLYITNAISRFMYGNRVTGLASRFIKEIGNTNLNNISKGYKKFGDIVKESIKVEKKENIEKKEPTKFSIGDKISHKLFGDGIVVNSSGTVITVAFKSPYGVKKLSSNHPSIRKL